MYFAYIMMGSFTLLYARDVLGCFYCVIDRRNVPPLAHCNLLFKKFSLLIFWLKGFNLRCLCAHLANGGIWMHPACYSWMPNFKWYTISFVSNTFAARFINVQTTIRPSWYGDIASLVVHWASSALDLDVRLENGWGKVAVPIMTLLSKLVSEFQSK